MTYSKQPGPALAFAIDGKDIQCEGSATIQHWCKTLSEHAKFLTELPAFSSPWIARIYREVDQLRLTSEGWNKPALGLLVGANLNFIASVKYKDDFVKY